MHPKPVHLLSSTAVLLFAMLLVGCSACSTRQNPDELREKTAQTTAELKSDAKAIAAGVKEGMKRDQVVDLNHASKEQLTKLPGIDVTIADHVIAGRPYRDAHELVSRRIVSQEEYQKIRDRIVAQ
jgi:DNA uptake protein ComE-like DNA-binding protein